MKILTYPLNLLDLLFTLYALSHGIPEANPLLQNTAFMVVYKVVVVGMLCWWLRRRTEPVARYGLNALAAVYGAVNLWHIWNLLIRR